MLNYKGYNIPNTFEEMLENNTGIRSVFNPMIPCITYKLDEGIIINSGVLVEEAYNKDITDERKESLLEQYTFAIKAYIDQKEKQK